MFHLWTIVEENLTLMMAAVPFFQGVRDAWTKNGTHFVGLCTSFVRQVSVLVGGTKTNVDIAHECRSLAMSPMLALVESANEDGILNDGCDQKMVDFNADHRVNYLKESLQCHDKVAEDFMVCQCADSAAVNMSIVTKMEHPHVSCKTHNLNL